MSNARMYGYFKPDKKSKDSFQNRNNKMRLIGKKRKKK